MLARCAQRRREERGKRPLFGGLHAHSHDPASLGVPPNAVQENRLSDAAQAVKDEALGRPPGADPVKGYRRLFDCLGIL